jgi:MFS-type transporter involved in bile tolerance (Atg22 family)
LLPWETMLALLAILGGALLIGRLARRITPTVELVLIGLITAIVAVEFASWQAVEPGSPLDVLRSLLPDLR